MRNGVPLYRPWKGHPDWVDSVVSSHDMTRLASATMDGTIKIWDPHCGQCLQTFKGHKDVIQPIATPNNSAWLASSSPEMIKIRDLPSGQLLHIFEGNEDTVKELTFHMIQHGLYQNLGYS
jgi:WD40 repeat protein